MQNKIEIINKRNSVEINIEGTIGVPEDWQFDEPNDRIATYDKFRNAIELIRQIDSPDVIINIRSTGGDVNDALMMHDAISSIRGKKRTRCYGYTASAATIIAQAASEGCREMSVNALYLIHNANCATEGNAAELEAGADLLRKTDMRIADIYATRSGRTSEEFIILMSENNGRGRWLSAEEAIAYGLIDAIIKLPEVSNYSVVDENNLIQNSMVKIKNTYNEILRVLGLSPKDGSAEIEITEDQIAVLNQSLENCNQEIGTLQKQITNEKANHISELETVQNRVRELEADAAKLGVKPTATKKIEDPTVTDDAKLDGNAKSYSEDVKKFS